MEANLEHQLWSRPLSLLKLTFYFSILLLGCSHQSIKPWSDESTVINVFEKLVKSRSSHKAYAHAQYLQAKGYTSPILTQFLLDTCQYRQALLSKNLDTLSPKQKIRLQLAIAIISGTGAKVLQYLPQGDQWLSYRYQRGNSWPDEWGMGHYYPDCNNPPYLSAQIKMGHLRFAQENISQLTTRERERNPEWLLLALRLRHPFEPTERDLSAIKKMAQLKELAPYLSYFISRYGNYFAAITSTASNQSSTSYDKLTIGVIPVELLPVIPPFIIEVDK